MAERKATWWLMGIASAAGTAINGFQVGWQYSGYETVVRNIRGPGTGSGSGSLNLDREGNVSIGNDIKDVNHRLMEVGVIFVFEWTNPKLAFGGKFDWIGKGDGHDVNKQNIVSKLEEPAGVTKPDNYWYQHGAKAGPYIVSDLLKQAAGNGGVIATVDVGRYYKAYSWDSIGK